MPVKNREHRSRGTLYLFRTSTILKFVHMKIGVVDSQGIQLAHVMTSHLATEIVLKLRAAIARQCQFRKISTLCQYVGSIVLGLLHSMLPKSANLIRSDKEKHSYVIGCHFLKEIRVRIHSRCGRCRFCALLLFEKIVPG